MVNLHNNNKLLLFNNNKNYKMLLLNCWVKIFLVLLLQQLKQFYNNQHLIYKIFNKIYNLLRIMLHFYNNNNNLSNYNLNWLLQLLLNNNNNAFPMQHSVNIQTALAAAASVGNNELLHSPSNPQSANQLTVTQQQQLQSLPPELLYQAALLAAQLGVNPTVTLPSNQMTTNMLSHQIQHSQQQQHHQPRTK
uniref:Uncharacterized protein n=1 Tax=Meloidogyne enterolobii TaxID=390850 RepID=A0A6V7Y3P8_MELEN|nr:unnamed protein product [Meloidogyne enterolobii]